jgi:hypothetical protein
MFSLVALILIGIGAEAHAQNCKPSTISIPIRASSIIYNGHDEGMPRNSCYRFSIDDREMPSPSNLEQVKDQIVQSMPHWIFRAIQESYGDDECIVRVNKLDYFGLLINYFLDKWKAAGVDVSNFTKPGNLDDESFSDKLQEEICKKIKSGGFKAHEKITVPG